MNDLKSLIEEAQTQFKALLSEVEQSGGLTKERYVRFLTMQYHLTKGVQGPFMAIAAHPATSRKKGLRKWLIEFAQEEEFHFEIAKADLAELGHTPDKPPLDSTLWWLYFGNIIKEQPFIRLGATAILENVSSGSSDLLDRLIKNAGYLTPKSLRFLTIHRHGPNLDHGSQVLDMLSSAELSDQELQDVKQGAQTATTLYFRLLHWVVTGKNK